MPRKDAKPSQPVVHHLPMTKARTNLDAIVNRVHLDKEYVILEKDGIPVAGLMDIDEFEDYLELRDPQVQQAIEQSRKEYQAGKSRPADALLAEISQPKRGTRNRRG